MSTTAEILPIELESLEANRQAEIAATDQFIKTDALPHLELAHLAAKACLRYGSIEKAPGWSSYTTNYSQTLDWLPITQALSREKLGLADEPVTFRVQTDYKDNYNPAKNILKLSAGGRMIYAAPSVDDRIKQVDKIIISSRLEGALTKPDGQAIARIDDKGYLPDFFRVSGLSIHHRLKELRIRTDMPFEKEFMGIWLPRSSDDGYSLRGPYLNAESESFGKFNYLLHTLLQEAMVRAAN